MNNQKLDKSRGSIYGLVIGDALGFPVEFTDLPDIRRTYGPQGVQDFEKPFCHPVGSYSDDTQMALCVARSLMRNGRGDEDALMEDMAREFMEWSKSEENNRAPGSTCMAGCRNLEAGKKWYESGIPTGKGCGSAMRVAPIGLVYHDDEKKLIDVATKSSLITHAHPTAVAAAVGAALLTAYAYNGDIKDAVGRVYDRTASVSREFADKLKQVDRVLHMEPDRAFDILGEGWSGHEAVAGALYSFLRSPADYKKTVLTAVNTQGDSDSFACIAGGMSGAYNGIQAIPADWVKRVENSDYLNRVAEGLAQV